MQNLLQAYASMGSAESVVDGGQDVLQEVELQRSLERLRGKDPRPMSLELRTANGRRLEVRLDE